LYFIIDSSSCSFYLSFAFEIPDGERKMKTQEKQKLYKDEIINDALTRCTIRELAKKSHVSTGTVVAAKRGENISIEKLRLIAVGIGMPICELIGCEHPIVAER
jgi:hypothetical protein